MTEAGNSQDEALTEERLRSALREVLDPEVGMNIVDLGLVYALRIAPQKVELDLTMTTPTCPMGSMIADEAREALARVASPGTDITVELVWDPPWDPSMMSDEARRHFGWR